MFAVKSNAKIIKYRQPDGSVIQIIARGDEFFSYFETLDGHIVSCGSDGFLYYGGFTANGFTLSSVRVSAANTTKSLPFGWSESLKKLVVIPSSLSASVASARGKARDSYSVAGRNLLSGNIKSLVLLVEFSDIKFTLENPKEYFTRLLNERGFSDNGATGSAADYFNDNFAGKCTFSFEVSEVISLPEKRAFYGARTATSNDADVEGMLLDAIGRASSAGVDFSKYDMNGDGFVDNIAVIFAGVDEPQSGNTDALWPMRGDLSAKHHAAGPLKAGSYTLSSELDYDSSLLSGRPASIGIFCHEFAHSIGLPDMYDVNGAEEGNSTSLCGSLSIMDDGNYLNEGRTPPLFTAIEREILEIYPVADIKPGREYVIASANGADSIYRIPLYDSGEYFLVESRSEKGWDSYCGGEGMVVYHVDKSDNMCGGLSAVRRWEYNIVNSYSDHACAKVLRAAETSDENSRVRALFFPGSRGVSELSHRSVNALADWKGRPAGVRLSGISFENGVSKFKAVEDMSWRENSIEVDSVSVVPFVTEAHLRWRLPSGTDTAGGFTTVSWHSASGDVSGSIRARGSDLLLTGLEPGEEYSGSIIFEKDMQCGAVKKYFVRTITEETSPYPFLKSAGKFRRGDRMYLRTINLPENCTWVKYMVNGKLCKDDYTVFTERGKCIISAVIGYSDGSEDVITKVMDIK